MLPRAQWTLWLGAVSLVLVACPSQGMKSADPPATCTKAGESCTFAPGKLGLCIEPTGGGAAFICQSQH